jgi:hypothetical protein
MSCPLYSPFTYEVPILSPAVASEVTLFFVNHSHSKVAHTSNSFFEYVVEYAYSVPVSGSVGISLIRFTAALEFSQKVHCDQISDVR